MLKVLIVEDEIMARKSLKRILSQNFPDIEVIGETGSVKETVEFLENPDNDPELIFMDIELSDGKCFEIFRQTEVNAKVVMTTAYDNYAIKAFEVNSIDYLLKPIDLDALKRAVERCRQRTENLSVDKILTALKSEIYPKSETSPNFRERFIVKFNDRIVPVLTNEIAFFYSEDKVNHVVTTKGITYILDLTLDAIMNDLNPDLFFKISRSGIVSKNSIESITKLFGGRLKITPKIESNDHTKGIELIVSRARTDEFLEWLEK